MKELKIYKGLIKDSFYFLIFNNKLKRQKIIRYNLDIKILLVASLDISENPISIKEPIDKYEFYFNKGMQEILKEILKIINEQFSLENNKLHKNIIYGANIHYKSCMKIINEFNHIINSEMPEILGD